MLYPQLLGNDFEKLPRSLRAFHSASGGASARGTATVCRTNGWLAGLIGFPRSGDGIPLQLRVIASDSREIWIRTFGGMDLRTAQWQEGNRLWESIGPVRFAFRIFADEKGMRFQMLRARLWFLPLPLRIEARAWGNDSAWEFHVSVAGVGWYRGTMVPTP